MVVQGTAGATQGNPSPWPTTRRERKAAIGRGQRKGGTREAGGKIRAAKPWECGPTTGAARPLEWQTSPQEWGTGRGSARPPEWRKTPGGGVPRSGRGSQVTTVCQHPRSGQGAPGGRNPRRAHSDQRLIKGGRTGSVRGQKPTHCLSNQDAGSRRRKRRANGQAEDGGAAGHTAGHGGGRQQRGDPVAAIRRRQRRQVQKLHAPAPRVQLTGVVGDGGGSSQCRGHR